MRKNAHNLHASAYIRTAEKSSDGTFRGWFSVHSTRLLSARHFRLVNRIRKPGLLQNQELDSRYAAGMRATRYERHFRRGRRQSIPRASFSPRKTQRMHRPPLYVHACACAIEYKHQETCKCIDSAIVNRALTGAQARLATRSTIMFSDPCMAVFISRKTTALGEINRFKLARR